MGYSDSRTCKRVICRPPSAILRPNVIAQVGRLDLRASSSSKGFLSGLHASPFQGFSVEFSEHRKYSPGDDLKDLDWNVYAKTDRYYVKKFQAETNVTGYLVMDLSASMDWCGVREMEKAKVAGHPALEIGRVRRRGRAADQVRVFDLPGGGARLPDDPSARPGRAGDMCRKNPRRDSATQQAHAVRQHPGPARESETGGANRPGPLPAPTRGHDSHEKPDHGLQRSA